jgi:hypothetical protein
VHALTSQRFYPAIPPRGRIAQIGKTSSRRNLPHARRKRTNDRESRNGTFKKMQLRLIPLAIGTVALAVCAVLLLSAQTRQSEYLALILLALGAVASCCGVIAGRSAARNISLVLASTLFTLCGLDIAAIVFGREPETRMHYDPNYAVESALGRSPSAPGAYKSSRTDTKRNVPIYDVIYTIDKNLLRQTISSDSGSAIAFFGDSFTFGEGVNDAQTLPQAFADLTDRKIRVLNLGFHGYGPEQFLHIVETGMFDHVLGNKPRLFVFQTAVWQADRTACKPIWVRTSPSYRLNGSEVTLAGRCSDTLRNIARRIAWKSAFFRQFIAPIVAGNVTGDDVALYLAVIHKAVELARERYGVPTVILHLSYTNEYLRAAGLTDDEIKRRLRETGAHVLDVTLRAPNGDPLVDYSVESPFLIPGDAHPSPLAHRTRAGLLLNYLQEKLPAVLEP